MDDNVYPNSFSPNTTPQKHENGFVSCFRESFSSLPDPNLVGPFRSWANDGDLFLEPKELTVWVSWEKNNKRDLEVWNLEVLLEDH